MPKIKIDFVFVYSIYGFTSVFLDHMNTRDDTFFIIFVGNLTIYLCGFFYKKVQIVSLSQYFLAC